MLLDSKIDQKELAKNAGLKAKNHWNNRLDGIEIENCFNDYANNTKREKHLKISIPLPSATFNALDTLAGELKAKHLVLMTTLGVLANKYSAKEDILILTPLYNNSVQSSFHKGIIPYRMNGLEDTFIKNLKEVKNQFLEDLKYGNIALNEMLETQSLSSKGNTFVSLVVDELQNDNAFDGIDTDLRFSCSFKEEAELTVSYQPGKFSELYARQIANRYLFLLGELLNNKNEKIDSIELSSEAEKIEILTKFNATNCSFPATKTTVDLFLEQVEKTPENIAIEFQDEKLTYTQLDQLSNQFANLLLKRNKPGDVIALLLERSLEQMIASFGILKAGCVYLPIAINNPKERISYMLENSSCKTLISDESLAADYQADMNTILVNSFRDSSAEAVNNSKPESSAYIIYTSGSTGKPKGVEVKHISLVNRLVWMQNEYALANDDVILQKTPTAFDVSLWELFWWSFTGAKLVLANPDDEKDPEAICKLIEKHQVTTMHFVPSMLNTFLGYLSEKKHLHRLESLSNLFASGEELTTKDAKQFLNFFEDSRLHNLYGPTEATVDVSFYEVTLKNLSDRIPIGKPIANTQLYVFNQQQQLQPVGVAGELYIGGVNVAKGYVNQSELTEERFVSNPLDKEDILYKTGDLARWLPDGNLEFLGRIDSQVKIRGNRVELSEIEKVIEANEEVKRAIVLAKPTTTSMQLVAYVLSEGDQLAEEKIREELIATLPDYMMPAFFISINSIPTTVSGKVDRKKLLAIKPVISTPYEAPETVLETQVEEIWSNILQTAQISVTDNFFRIGGDSILSVRMIGLLNSKLSLNLNMNTFLDNPTIRELSAYITNNDQDHTIAAYQKIVDEVAQYNIDYQESHSDIAIEAAYPMSDIEKGMVFVHLSKPDEMLYFEQNSIPVHYESLDIEIFKKATALLIKKHPILRTGYDLKTFTHIVYKELEANFVYHNLEGMSQAAQEEEIKKNLEVSRTKHFDFGEAPLWRVGLYKLSDSHHILAFEVHHAIFDGWSYASFITELNNTYVALCKDSSFSPGILEASFADYITEELYQKQNKEAADFWKKELKGHQKLAFETYGLEKEHKATTKDFDKEILTAMEAVADQHNISMKHLFFSVYLYTLKILTDKNDLLVGLVGFNRPMKKDGDKLLGCFLNTVPVRFQIAENITWNNFISAVSNKLNEIRNYEALSLFEINRAIGGNPEEGNPLFDTLFNFVNFHVLGEMNHENVVKNENDEVDFDNFLRGHTLFDVTIDANENGLQGMFNYVTSFIDDSTYEAFLSHFEFIMNAIVEDAEAVIEDEVIKSSLDGEIDALLSESEKEMINPYLESGVVAENETVIDQFRKVVKMMPENTAIRFENESVSYQELAEQANKVTAFLQKNKQVKKGSKVAVILNRETKLLPVLLGIQQAGAAYIPIDPKSPNQRVKDILKDAKVSLLISRKEFINEEGFDKTEVIDLDVAWNDIMATEEVKSKPLKGTDLAYIIYTSGTSGKPKGVMIEHASLSNYIGWATDHYQINSHTTFSLHSSIAFDLTVTSLFTPLVNGSTVKIFEGTENTSLIQQVIRDSEVDFIKLTPTHLRAIKELPIASNGSANRILKLVVGGEELTTELAEAIYEKFEGEVKIYNEYGPTETTVGCMIYDFVPGETRKSVAIGRPVANAGLCILNRYGQLVPASTPGELYISGAGLARGYVNNRSLNAAKFVSVDGLNNIRFYNTGDLAQWLPTGKIEFLGRVDEQVKIRGYRIEPLEIEAALNKHEQVKTAVVLAKESARDKYLVAYFTTNDFDNAEAVRSSLKAFLNESLPDYMVPSFFVPVEKIPLTTNAKVDKKSLLKIDEKDFVESTEFEEPTGEIEVQVAKLWCEILEIEKVSANDNFFELGGHSLNMITLVNEIQRIYDIELSLEQLFKKPTVKLMAEHIEALKWIREQDSPSAEEEGFLSIEIDI